jgi:hypothetical protein
MREGWNMDGIRRPFVAAVACAVTFLLPGVAQAIPPTLEKVEETSTPGVLTASWTQPDTMLPDVVEVGISPKVSRQGDFTRAVVYDLPTTFTSWTAAQPLPAGKYYVHIGAIDTTKCMIGNEPECNIHEFSNVLSVTIAGTPPAPPAAPVLDSVGEDGQHLTAGWTLAAGTAADFIEVATSPDVYQEGEFLSENTVLFEYLDGVPLPYVSADQLAAGTYYVHVASYDPARCTTFMEPACLTDAFSNILEVVIPPDDPGDGGSAGGSTAVQRPVPKPKSVVADKSTRFATLTTASKQDVDKLVVVASMAEAGTLTVGGTVNVPNLSKVYRFKTASATAAPGAITKLKLTLPEKAVKAVKRALKRHKKVKARLTITAKDKAGNEKTEKRTVALRP